MKNNKIDQHKRGKIVSGLFFFVDCPTIPGKLVQLGTGMSWMCEVGYYCPCNDRWWNRRAQCEYSANSPLVTIWPEAETAAEKWQWKPSHTYSTKSTCHVLPICPSQILHIAKKFCLQFNVHRKPIFVRCPSIHFNNFQSEVHVKATISQPLFQP